MFSRIVAARRGLALACVLFLGLMSGCGGNTPAPAVPTAPVITTQPLATQTVTAGTSVSFTVVATGNPAPTYQWKKGSVNVATGGTSATYTIASPVVGDAGTYTVTVTNSVSAVTSTGALLNVNPAATAPTIDTQPAATTTVLEGGSATLSVSASVTDGGTLSYQWKHGTTIVGSNSNSIILNPVLLSGAGSYTVVVTNTLNGTTAQTTSNTAVLTVQVPVSITTPPAAQTVTVGGSTSFSVTATGTGPLTYQWQKDTVDIIGATSATLPLTNLQTTAAGSYRVVVTGAAGSVISPAAVLTVNAPVAFTTPPAAQTVSVGGSASFSVVFTGTGPFTYQWQKDTVDIIGATSATLPLTNVQTTAAGSYRVVVTGAAGPVTSAAAILTVQAPIAITVPPAAQTASVGGSASFSVTFTGTGPCTYQWQKDGGDISGATNATLPLTNVQLTDAGSYRVIVTGVLGPVTSAAATLTVNVPVVYTTPPAAQTVAVGGSASFSVVFTGTGPFTYQWQKDAGNIPGATSATLDLTNIQLTDAGSYRVIVTGAAGPVTSAAAILTVQAPIAITVPPAAQTASVGGSASFSVTFTGTGPCTYQWQKDASNLPGATNATLSLTNVQLTDAGSYRVIVTGVLGPVTSAAATLTVNVATTITLPPAAQTVTVGGNVSFSVTATGGGTLTYQWQKNTADIPGATSANLDLFNVQTTAAGSYRVIVTGTSGSVTSAAATLTVQVPVAITLPPASQTVYVGQTASFSVTATGTGTLSYQWQKDTANIPSAISATLNLTNVQTTDAGSYRVIVTGTVGPVTSAAATLTVDPAPAGLSITADPQSKSVVVPDGATFSVKATGSGLTYTWKKNGTAITGAPSASSYTVAATDLRNVADQYSVTVTDGVTSVTSAAATLAVSAPNPVYAGDPTQNLGHLYEILPSWFRTAPADTTQGSFRFGYDSTVLNPAWVAACFFPIMGEFSYTRPGSYPTDTRLSGATPIQETDYQYSTYGYSRGHQVGIFDLATRYGQEAGSSTMYMSNMCPQTQALNGGVWLQLAEILNGGVGTQSFCNAFGRVWIYTGPLFTNALVTPIGPRNISVPSAFYNIVVRETSPGNPVALAMIIPHSTTIQGGTRAVALTDCWKYVTTIDRVQALTGLTFFPAPSTTTTLPATFTSVVDVRGWGSSLENGIGKPNVHMIEPSWDSTFTLGYPLVTAKINSGTVDTPMNFVGQATTSGTGTASNIASTTWTFGDGGTANVPSTTHTYTAGGDYTVTFSAMDGAGVSNSISRVITIAGSGPSAPTITTIADVSTNDTTPKTVNFTVSDAVTVAGSITVTATSDTPGVLVNNLVVNNANGACSLVLTPIAGSLGYSTVTITATNGAGTPSTKTFKFTVTATPVGALLNETFETGTTSGYFTGNVALSSGTWAFVTTMTGNTSGDIKNGLQSVRLKNLVASSIAMTFDVTNATSVSMAVATYGASAGFSLWGLYYSTDGGTTWTQVGSNINTASHVFATQTFPISVTGTIRFKVLTDATSTRQLNLDDFVIQ